MKERYFYILSYDTVHCLKTTEVHAARHILHLSTLDIEFVLAFQSLVYQLRCPWFSNPVLPFCDISHTQSLSL